MKKIRFITLFLIIIFTICFQNIHIVSANEEKGTTYYISSDGVDSNSGTSPEEPVSYNFANKYAFSANDTILLKRGDTFYGTLAPIVDSGEGKFTIADYGKGELPIIKTVQVTNDEWKKENDGFYSFDLKELGNHTGVGGTSSNICRIEDASGKTIGRLMNDKVYCEKEYDYYIYDNCVYMKSKSELTSSFGKLEFVLEENGIEVSNNFHIKNLKITNCGRFGINFGNTVPRNVSINNCIITDNGNGLRNDGFSDGGGIMIYDGCFDVNIKKNIISDNYGPALRIFGGHIRYWNELSIKNNIISNNTQALSIDAGGNDPDIGLDNVYFMNNLCVNQGKNIENEIFDLNQSSDILIGSFGGQLFHLYIKGNTFINGNDEWRYISCNYDERFASITSGNNHIYASKEDAEIINLFQYYSEDFEADDDSQQTLFEIQDNFDIERGSEIAKADKKQINALLKQIATENYSKSIKCASDNFTYERMTDAENPFTFKDFVGLFHESVIVSFLIMFILGIALIIYKIILKKQRT